MPGSSARVARVARTVHVFTATIESAVNARPRARVRRARRDGRVRGSRHRRIPLRGSASATSARAKLWPAERERHEPDEAEVRHLEELRSSKNGTV
jgi:ribosomal protein S13